jgi:hypothetical protein
MDIAVIQIEKMVVTGLKLHSGCHMTANLDRPAAAVCHRQLTMPVQEPYMEGTVRAFFYGALIFIVAITPPVLLILDLLQT